MPIRIAILVGTKGRGSNMAAIISACQNKKLDAIVSVVMASSDASPAVQTAQEMGVSAVVLSPKSGDYANDLIQCLTKHSVDIICLAGYMTLLPKEVLQKFPGRVLNIHPALLPKYGGKGMYGLHVHRAVLDSGDLRSGCTVHFVTEAYDEGAILMQATCEVDPQDTPETLAVRVLQLEHETYPAAIKDLMSQIETTPVPVPVPVQENGSNVALGSPVPHGRHSLSLRASYWLVRIFAWLLLAAFGAPMRRINARRVPRRGPLLVFSNHISNCDPVLVQFSSPRLLHFMTRRDLFNMGVLGNLVRWFRSFPVIQSSPDKGAIKQALKYLSEGAAVAVFPEGQLSASGKLGSLFAGAALLVRRSGAQVICVGITGSNSFMPFPQTKPRWAGKQLIARWGEPIQFPPNTSSQEILSHIEKELLFLTKSATNQP